MTGLTEKDIEYRNDNYGLLFKFSTISSSRIPVVVISIFMVFQSTCMVITTIVAKDDLGMMYESAHTFCLIAMTEAVRIQAHLNQPNYDAFWRGMGSLRYDYEIDSETAKCVEEMRREGRKKKKYAPRFLLTIMCVIAFSTLLRTFDMGKSNEVKSDGIIRNMPVPYWHPLDGVNYWIPYLLALASELIVIYLLTFVMLAVDLTFACMAFELCTEYEILEYTLRNVVESAMRFNDENFKFNKGVYDRNSETFILILKGRMRDCARHHQHLLRLTNALIAINLWPLLIYTTSLTFLICLSGVLILKDEVPLVQKLSMIFLIAMEVLQIFMYCYFSEKLKEKVENVRYACYNSNWWDYSLALRKDILIIQANTANPKSLSAGGFTNVDLTTFSAVIQSSYSYLNLLLVFNESN